MNQSLHLIVRGEVQGVGFRYFTQSEAEKRGLTGWVRNLRGGAVEAYAEGETDALDDWLAALHRGPASARVKEILSVRGTASIGARGFEARPTADRPDPFHT